MRIIRFRTLRTFFITSKNLRRSIVAINIGIFLAIFAATSAIITVFVENELTDYEFSNLELRSTYRNFNDFSSLMPALKSSLDRVETTNQTATNYIELLAETNQGSLIIDAREKYFYRFYSIFHLIEDFFVEDLSFKTGLGMDVAQFYKSMDNLNQDLIDRFIQAEINYERYKEQFIKIKKKVAPDDRFEIVDPQNFLKNEQTSEYALLMDKYKDLSQDMNNSLYFIEEYVDLLERLMIDLKKLTDQDLINNTNQITKLSNLESKLILFAFILQFFIFLITQFFEISTMNREAKDKIE